GTSKTQQKKQRKAFYKTAWPCLKQLSDGLAARMLCFSGDTPEYQDIFPKVARKKAFCLLLSETLEKENRPAWRAFLGPDDQCASENTWPRLCAGEQMIDGVSLRDLDAVFLNLLRMQFFYAANTKHTLRAWHDRFKVFATQNPLPKRDVVFALCQFIIEEQLSRVVNGIQRIHRIAKEDPTLDDYIAQRANASKASASSASAQPSVQLATTPEHTTFEATADLVIDDQPAPEEATALLSAEQQRALQVWQDHQLAKQLSEQFAAKDHESAAKDQERITEDTSKQKPKKRRKKKRKGKQRR
ncbi:MAG: hypothetical protein ACPG7U_01080, partial [Holosporaceae bacterium]